MNEFIQTSKKVLDSDVNSIKNEEEKRSLPGYIANSNALS